MRIAHNPFDERKQNNRKSVTFDRNVDIENGIYTLINWAG